MAQLKEEPSKLVEFRAETDQKSGIDNNALTLEAWETISLPKLKKFTLRFFLPGAFYTAPGPPGATEDINLAAYSRILIKLV